MVPNVTQMLRAWSGGDQKAADELMPLVYDHLKQLAGRYLSAERHEHTLQPTALVHEAYLKLVGADVPWQDRIHFFALAARTMRRILVDHAKAHLRGKRGGGQEKMPLEDLELAAGGPPQLVIALDEALNGLEQQDARKAELVHLLYFGGLTYAEAAVALSISEATVHRELRLAKAWLHSAMKSGSTQRPS